MQTARDKIRELHALHQDGLISEREFDSRKNAILDAEYAPPGIAAAPGARQGTEIGLMAGQEIGPQNRRYRLERLIAHGGLGQVWEATDLATHAELGHSGCVALKILPPQLTSSATHARLLVEEATQARRLAHEHIVRVYEWAQDPATASYFIIMECLRGEDLDSLMAREGPFTLARAAQLLAPVADALQYAWDKHQLVHRDIKPGNVFVTEAGDVKLLDFGIAARARGSGPGPGPGLQAPPGSGTAGYRAPEAAAALGPPGQALDVYAVAVMIYQMLEGRMPFDGRAPGHQPEQPRSLSARQWTVLQSGFAREPAARPATVAALLAQLDGADGATAREQEREHEREKQQHEKQRHEKQQHEEKLAARRAQQATAATAAAAAAAQAAAHALHQRERRAQAAAERAQLEAARRARKETLRQQLRERRAADAEQARLALEEQQRKAVQAKAAAAYRAEQQRARADLAARTAAELAALMPTAWSPVADTEGVLRDRFIGGDGVGPELVLIPTGRFQMGSPEHERAIAMEAGAQAAWLARETPQHWVGIEQPLALGRYPVTVGEWRQFVRATGWQPSGDFDWRAPGFPQADSHPVVGVSWDDAGQYVRWLSENTGQAYRLPSEAEWEYACRAGTKTAFSFGDDIDPALANYDGNYSYHGSPRGPSRKGTSSVGAYPPNPWGLFDMHGNVWEWVQDVVHDNYDGAPADGAAWEEGGDPNRRVLRGGSWLYNPRYLRSALRNGFSSILSNDIVGFRVARKLV